MSTVPAGVWRLSESFNAALSERNVDKAQRLAAELANSRLFSLRAYAEPEGAATSSGGALPEESLLVSLTLQAGDSRSCGPLRLVMPRTACIADLKDETLLVLTYLVTSNPEHWPPKKDHLEQLKAAVRAERDRQVIRREDSEYDEGSAGSVGPPQPQQPEVEEEPGWSCPKCTFRNEPVRPGCQMCGGARPPDYEVPAELQAEEEQRQLKLHGEFLKFRATLRRRALRNPKTAAAAADSSSSDSDDEENKADEPREAADPYTVTICPKMRSDSLSPTERERERNFRELMNLTQGSLIPVPAQQGFECPICLCDVGGDDDDGDGIRGLRLRECGHEAFVELVDNVNEFECEVCQEHNCVTCRASHKDLTCQQYQDDLRRRAENDENAKLGLQKLEDMLQSGEAMKCPKCQVFLSKREGCDWLMCSVCRTEICWATRGPRWGPGGQGDTSGGCRCRVNNKKCHPNCMNCH
uniref:RanBP2-type domain-containing protein n=1 Tax=Macrostomum lignano TaxID=282301 RepID=A0A1I8IRV9_9PLAT